MKTVKKLLSVVLALTLIGTSLVSGISLPVSAEEFTEGYYTYEIKNGGAIITYVDNAISGDVVIPDTLGGYPVTEIDYNAFYNCESLTSITIPDSVTSISSAAFQYCSSLTSIAIPDSVTEIGEYAFYNTGYYNDESNWENDVLYIGNHLIKAKNNISGDYSIKEGTKTIAEDAFQNCTSLTNVVIPDGVTSIGYGAFEDCYSLTRITIPDSVTHIDVAAFNRCESLTSIEIPHSIIVIDNWTFSGCTNLTSITIPDSVTSIGNDAFQNCTSLTNMVIPDGVTSIGDGAFYNTGYYNDESNWENGVLYIGNHLIEAKEDISGDYLIKEDTKTIAHGAFMRCTSLTSMTIPDSVTSIGGAAFSGCESLTSITIPDSVTEIGEYAFYHCESLTNITIPDSVTTIGEDAFNNCTSLTSVTIPDSVTTIGNDAFGYYYDYNKYEYLPILNFTIYGYIDTAAEEYALENGFEFIALSYEDKFTFNSSSNTVTGVKAGLSASDITSEIKDKNGNTLASDALIGTGCTITKDGKEYTVIVSGDSSGDGLVNSTDFMQVRRQYLGLFSMNTAQSLAADVTGDDNINSTDFTRIRRHFLGLYDLYA